MSLHLMVTLLRHGVRNVRHGGIPFFFATLMTALGLFALAIFATVLLNFQRLVDEIGDTVGAVAFLDVGGATQAEEVRGAIRLLPGVAQARLVTPEEAMARVRRSLGETGSLLEGAAGVQMPWVVEITPDLSVAVPTAEVIEKVKALDGVDEVMHPGGDLSRIEAAMSLLRGAGVFLALLIVMVVIVVVSNTVKLTLFARREEIAILKLVGATDAFVRVPFLIEGLIQGVGGAVVALLGLVTVHATVAGLIEVALEGALGSFQLMPLPWTAAVWIVLGGAVLGVGGAALSIGRFLKV